MRIRVTDDKKEESKWIQMEYLKNVYSHLNGLENRIDELKEDVQYHIKAINTIITKTMTECPKVFEDNKEMYSINTALIKENYELMKKVGVLENVLDNMRRERDELQKHRT